MFESEMFGHEAGAYQCRQAARIGKIEYADGGTLFLDEIESLLLNLQAKLLRVLQERTVERLGSNESRQLDLRAVAATKCDLAELAARGGFRADLYYRLHVAMLTLPLRERKDDIEALMTAFIQDAAGRWPPAATVYGGRLAGAGWRTTGRAMCANSSTRPSASCWGCVRPVRPAGRLPAKTASARWPSAWTISSAN